MRNEKLGNFIRFGHSSLNIQWAALENLQGATESSLPRKGSTLAREREVHR